MAERMNNMKLRAMVNVEVTDDDILSVLISAVNEGCITWMNDPQMTCEDILEALNKGDVTVSTVDGEYHLSKDGIYNGIRKYIESGEFEAVTMDDQDEIAFDIEHLYADGSDYIMQIALFGEMRY